MIETRSLCPVCYREIPATISYIKNDVVMNKRCNLHGEFSSLIESNAIFYEYWRKHNSDIYDGHFIDVTERCNINCEYCFYEKGKRDVYISTIMDECSKGKGPYILTGGEPTLREDLPEIIERVSQYGEVHLVTNGFGFSDKDYLNKCIQKLTQIDDCVCINLSYHKESNYIFYQALKNMIDLNYKLLSVLFVIDDISQLDYIQQFGEKYKDYIKIIRIKIATQIWNETKKSTLFSSEVVRWFVERSFTKFPDKGKMTYLPFQSNGVTYAVVKWYDVWNIDLNDIDSPPTYTAKDGVTRDFVHSMIVNEGINKGWLNGVKYDKG